MTAKTMTSSAVFSQLSKEAEKPFDLTSHAALLNGERLKRYVCSSPCYNLYYATQRVDDSVLGLLGQLAADCQVVEQFKSMRRGEKLNRIEGYESENRQVLHTASRDIFSASPCEPEAFARTKRELDKLTEFLDDIEQGAVTGSTGKKFDTMIQVGIGGSDLGPRAVFEALKAYGKGDRKAFFIANVDPDDAAAVLAKVNLETTLVNIVSKSGSTLETLTNQRLVEHALREKGLDPAKHCIAVTGEGSPLDNPDIYLRSFYMYDYIGGRYSATSMVGAVVLGFYLGMDELHEFLRGADEMDHLAEHPEMRNNLPLLLAMLGIWNHNFLGYPTVAVLPYSQALHRFPAHLQQCDMESNGKSIDRQGNRLEIKSGPVVWGEPGTNGQHAFYQLLHQGTEIVPVELIGFLEKQYQLDLTVQETTSQQKLVANLLAQSVAFATGKNENNPNKAFTGNRPSLIMMGRRLTPRSMGALLAIYEAKIVMQGFVWNINSFDQEGVQLGKVLADRFLALMREQKKDDHSLESYMLEIVGEAGKCC